MSSSEPVRHRSSTPPSSATASNDISFTAVVTAVSAFPNSDVLPKAAHPGPSVHAVAVAVTTSPKPPAKLYAKKRDPPPVCATTVDPAKTCPSPFPLGSAPNGFLKNSTR